ncbi:MAG: nucleic acid-binding protein [Gemmataceae bacterium]
MRQAVVLDTDVIGLLTTPPGRSSHAADCARWLADLVRAGRRVLVPEIADYESRRELIRLKRVKALRSLDWLSGTAEYLPIPTDAMRRATELWATVRQGGKPTAGDNDLDADMILAVQALTLGVPFIVATTNVRHLGRVVPADLWSNIPTI